ncbi:hypothetical protein BDR26DRAFT_929634 [Obelidium mucronatum]|nr:hypothetical protein BDR26DRAFT_929634 [Obelidium mucronatum]
MVWIRLDSPHVHLLTTTFPKYHISNSSPKVIDADTVYIEKLKASLSDMNAVKEAAIRSENYLQAEQIRQKMIALESQLASMEYQFNADIIINSVTNWQIELAKSMSNRLDDVKSFVRDCSSGTFPLKDLAQLNFISFVEVLPTNYYDALVRSLLLVMPNEVLGAQKSPFGWEHFARRIPQIQSLPPDSVEYLRSVLVLAIIDVIIRISHKFNETIIKRETNTLFIKHAFSYFKTASLRRLAIDHEAKVFEKISTRWAIIIGDLSVVGPTEILKQVFGVLDHAQKRTPDEIVLILSSVRYIFSRPLPEQASNTLRLIRELVGHYERTKKTVVRLAIIQCLEKIVQPLDFTLSEGMEPWESQLHREMMDLYKTVSRWGNASEDLKAAATRVCITILANASYEFFQPTLSALLVDLVNKPKIKPYVYHGVLQILRGRFFLDTKDTALSKLINKFSTEESFGYLCRPFGEESQQVISDRIKFIADSLFVRRKDKIPTDCMDVVNEILKSVENAENCYLALRAIRNIIDPDTGFLTNSTCSRVDPRFAEMINGIPYEFDASLVNLVQFCDSVAGISVLGISGLLVEPGQGQTDDSVASAIAAAKASGRLSVLNGSMSSKVEKMYARGDTDLVAMLSESMETMSMRNSVNFSNLDTFWNAGPALETKKILEKDLSSKEIDDQNDIVHDTVKDWYAKIGQPKENIKKFAFSSTLENGATHAVPSAPIDRSGRERHDLLVILQLFREIIRILPFIPQPELVSGKLFIGPYLLHSHLALAKETSSSMERVFIKYPEMRIEIIKAILDLIKNTSLSDISYATIMLHLTALIRHWSKDFDSHSHILDGEQIMRISCKLDACLLIMMARPNPRIRHASLSALSDFYTISQAVSPHLNEPGFLPLQAILNQRNNYLSKNAMYAFMERDLLGHKLTPGVIGAIKLLPLNTIASSDYSLLFKFYLGELARQFCLSGRPKALRHCAKFLSSLAVPYMTSVTTVDNEFVITYSNYMVLLMALGGVPLKSEDGYSLESYSSADNLLFNNFRHFLAPILNSDNIWEIRAIVQASYFMHISLYQLYVVHLWQWYAETRQNSLELLHPRMIDNIMYALRSLSQNRDFEIIAREPSVFQSSIIEIIVDFIRMTQSTLQGLNFSQEVNLLRVKLAINFCTVVARLAFAIFSAQRFIMDEQEVFIDGVSRPSLFLDISFPGLGWDLAPRQDVVFMLQDLTDAVESAIGFNDGVPKMEKYQGILLDKIGLAAECLLVLGDVFEGDALPSDLLLWLSKLQRSGFNVYPPPLLCNYENALGTVLAHSYSLTGSKTGFLNAVFSQVLPRPLSTLAFGGNYVEMASIEFASEISSENTDFITPDGDQSTLKKIRQNIGSLIFCGIYNLLNADKSTRCRAFKFVRELFVKFGENRETINEIDRFASKISTKAAEPLRKIAIRISQMASTFFSADAPSFFWEAVRCSRTAQKNDTELLLVPSQQLILEVVLPWCRYVNFSDIDEDLVFAEFFRYLMDATFYRPKFIDEVKECWISISSSLEFGRGNSEVLTEMLLHIRGKLKQQCENLETLLFEMFQAHHITVADASVFYLQARSFPWDEESDKNFGVRSRTRAVIKEYVSVLHIALTGTQFDPILEYPSMANASVALIGELFMQDFVVLRRYLPLALNYSILHLPNEFAEKNDVVELLLALIDGYWGARGSIGASTNNEKLLQKLTSLKQYMTAPYSVEWKSYSESTSSSTQQFKIFVGDFVSLIMSIFEIECSTLIIDITDEVVCWARDGLLDSEISTRAVILYNTLIKCYPDLLSESYHSFPALVADQVSEVLSVQHDSKVTDLSQITAEGKRRLEKIESLLASLVQLHGSLMGTIGYDFDERCLLFWESVSLLKLPCDLFPDIWVTAVENCIRFLKESDASQIGHIKHHFEPIRGAIHGVQAVLIEGLFSKVDKIQDLSFEFLVLCWSQLPGDVVDSSSTGILYTCLNVIMWIFSLLRESKDLVIQERSVIKETILRFQRTLSNAGALEFAGVIKSLQTLAEFSNAGESETLDTLLEKCTANIAQVYFPENVGVIAEFCSYFIQLGGEYCTTSLKMLEVFWSLAQRSPKSSGAFKSLMRKLAFFEDRRDAIDGIFSFILSDSADSDDPIKEIDLTSYGKVETLEGFQRPVGSVDTVVAALHSLR